MLATRRIRFYAILIRFNWPFDSLLIDRSPSLASGHRQVWFDYDSIDSGATWHWSRRSGSAEETAEHGRYRGLLHGLGRFHLYAGQLRQGHLPGDPEDLRDPDAGPVGVRDAGQAALLAALRIPAELGDYQIVLGHSSMRVFRDV